LRAVVFDFDGLVVETEEPEFVAWQEVFDRHGTELLLEEYATGIGTIGGFDPLALLTARAPLPVDAGGARAQARRRHQELVMATVLQAGVVQVLDQAAALGLGVAIASSSPRQWIADHLDRIGLRDRFAVIACFDDVGVAKPAPDVYLEAVRRLGVAAGEAVALEDSRAGLLAARAAGLRCIAVPTAMTRHLDFSAADLVIDSLAELDLSAITTR
jgi:HAD superfamily hydrolase (TIGR01509 family)